MKKLLLLLVVVPQLVTAQLVINEIAPNNRVVADEDGQFPDWIEIMNIGAADINVQQYAITDNPDTWNKWLLPNYIIEAGERLLIFASEKNRDCYGCPGIVNYLHTNFKLSNGETVALYDESGNLIDSVTIGNVYATDVMARIPDGGDWCYADTETAKDPNSVTCYTEYSEEPVFNTLPGFYAGSIDVTISGTDIFYSTNGDWPDVDGIAYTAPVTISTTKVVKAVSKQPGKLPSRTITGTFFIDETTQLPVVSISSNSCDMFNEGFSCEAAYDGADGWEPDNPQIPAGVEYFTADHVQKISKNIKFEAAGNSSIAVYPQKGMQFTADEDFGDNSEYDFNVFENYKPLDSLNGFRVRANNDWGNSNARMKDVINNRLAAPTHIVTPAYQNVATFINGEYWGLYSAREELDKYFLRNNQGVNPDKVDIIRSGAGEDVWDIAEAGTITAYNELKTFFNTHSMTNPDHYALALELIDIENWVDHFALQFFVNNDEMAYNLRCFRSYEPDMKWKFILWDTGAGSECPSCNSIETLINFPYLSEEINMMNELVDNTDFRNYFINRYADLMNYYFTWEIVENLIDVNADEIEAEIPAQYGRWGAPSVGAWNSGVNELKDFFEPRVGFQRNEIENYFDLNDQVTITLEVNPPGAGYIKISTIVPENLPWSGVYFDGVPVTVTAIPNPGFTFSNWSDNPFITDATALSFNNNFTDNTTFTANFTGVADFGIVISEVNYNSNTFVNSGDWIELYNPTAVDIVLTAYQIGNKEFYTNYKIADNVVLPAGGYLVVAENLAQFSAIYPDVTNVVGDMVFNFSNDGDSIVLRNPVGQLITGFAFEDKFPWPATADGFGRTMEFDFTINEPASPTSWFAGCVLGSPGMAYSNCFENPIIDEINYHASDAANSGDWFELFNWSAADFDLSGYTIQDESGNSFIIPEGTSVTGDGGYLVFYQDETLFSSQFPDVTNKVGPLNFGFNDGGDIIVIYDQDGQIFQSVSFEDVAPYPLSPDGGGTALQIVSIGENMNKPSNWMESCPAGTPGSLLVMPCITGIEEQEIDVIMKLQPNPATSVLHITFTRPLNACQLSVYDITGKLMLKHNIQQSNLLLDVANYNSGMYVIEVVAENEHFTNTFIKQ